MFLGWDCFRKKRTWLEELNVDFMMLQVKNIRILSIFFFSICHYYINLHCALLYPPILDSIQMQHHSLGNSLNNWPKKCKKCQNWKILTTLCILYRPILDSIQMQHHSLVNSFSSMERRKIASFSSSFNLIHLV